MLRLENDVWAKHDESVCIVMGFFGLKLIFRLDVLGQKMDCRKIIASNRKLFLAEISEIVLPVKKTFFAPMQLTSVTLFRQSLKATDPTTLNIVLQYVQLAQPDLSEHIMLLRPDLSTSHSTPTAQLVATLHEKLFVGSALVTSSKVEMELTCGSFIVCFAFTCGKFHCIFSD